MPGQDHSGKTVALAFAGPREGVRRVVSRCGIEHRIGLFSATDAKLRGTRGVLTTPTISRHDRMHGVHPLGRMLISGGFSGGRLRHSPITNENFQWLRLCDTKETTILTSWHQVPSSRDKTSARSPRRHRAFENFFLLSEACRTRTHRRRKLVRGEGEGKEGKKREKCVIYVLFQSIFFLTSFRSFCFFPIAGGPSAEDFFPKPTFFPSQSCWTRFNRYSVPVRPAVVSCSAMMSPRSTRVAISFLKSTASIAIALSNLL